MHSSTCSSAIISDLLLLLLSSELSVLVLFLAYFLSWLYVYSSFSPGAQCVQVNYTLTRDILR